MEDARLPESLPLDEVPADVPRRAEVWMGRYLVEAGFELVAGYTTMADNPMTRKAMLDEMDSITRYERAVHTPKGEVPTVIGPYYTVVNDEEFCPVGVGVWRPKA